MRTKIEKSIEISRPPDEVFEYLGDIDRLQDWATTVVETRDVPGGAITEGATFRQANRFAGRSVETQGRVTEFEPPRRIASEATAPGGGRLMMREIVEPSGSGSAREAEHSLQNLKDLLEGRPATQP